MPRRTPTSDRGTSADSRSGPRARAGRSAPLPDSDLPMLRRSPLLRPLSRRLPALAFLFHSQDPRRDAAHRQPTIGLPVLRVLEQRRGRVVGGMTLAAREDLPRPVPPAAHIGGSQIDPSRVCPPLHRLGLDGRPRLLLVRRSLHFGSPEN